MSWRDELRLASFRGVPFHVDSSTTRQGLHADEQVFPGRSRAGDAVHVEHLGMGPRRFQVDAFVVGDDVFERRNALEAALLEPGSGRLVHPYRGELVVAVVGQVSTVESRQRGGYARITFACVVTEEPTLRRSPDTGAIVERDLDAFINDLARDFGEAYETEGLPDAFQESGGDAFTEAVGMLEDAYSAIQQGLGQVSDFTADVGAFTSALSAVASAPFEMAETLLGALAAVAAVPERAVTTALSTEQRAGALVDTAMSAMAPLRAFGERFEELPTTTPNRQRERVLRDLVVQLVRGGAIAETIRCVSQLPFASRNQAIAVRDALVADLDRIVEEGTPGGETVSGARLYEALAAARAAAAAHLSAVARTLPELTTYTVTASLPVLVVAHELYGDARRAADIIARNDPPTPGWLPVGAELEVVRG